MPHKSKILFILKDRILYGQSRLCSYGLVNACTFVANALNQNGIEAKIVTVPDNNSIDREVFQYKPTHVIIEALWVVPEKFKILAKLHPYVHWIIRLHSAIPFLAIEGNAIEWINQYLELQKSGIKISVACNKVENVKEFNLLYSGISYLPNIYYPLEEVIPHNKTDHEYINIGCFGALRPLKNTLQQAIWALEFVKKHNKKLNFHINHSQHESSTTDPIYRNLNSLFNSLPEHKLTNHHWVSHSEFLKIVNQMDLGMQLSYTETFNIVAADFVYCNVPIIVSEEIDWLFPMYRAEPSNPRQVLDRMEFAYKGREHNKQRINLDYLKNYNEKAAQVWLEYFK